MICNRAWIREHGFFTQCGCARKIAFKGFCITDGGWICLCGMFLLSNQKVDDDVLERRECSMSLLTVSTVYTCSIFCMYMHQRGVCSDPLLR